MQDYHSILFDCAGSVTVDLFTRCIEKAPSTDLNVRVRVWLSILYCKTKDEPSSTKVLEISDYDIACKILPSIYFIYIARIVIIDLLTYL